MNWELNRGKIDWDELEGIRTEKRRAQLEKILDQNSDFYRHIKDWFGKGRYYRTADNHDTYYNPASSL